MKNLHPIYQLLLKIPKGKVTTYGAIGKKLGLNPRHVGQILHVNPDAPKVPCHRVVRHDGSLAIGYALGGLKIQKQMLEKEGVKFHNQKVLKTCII